MKPILVNLAVASIVLMAQPVLAQSQSASSQTAPARPANEPAVAATLPNAFENTQQSTPRAPAAQPARPAPANVSNAARSETALRAIITGLQSGTVDYSAFTDDLAAQVREQADTIGSLLTQFGPVKSMTHKGQPQGADLFEVQFENQKTEWVIGFDNDDQIAALLFRPAES